MLAIVVSVSSTTTLAWLKAVPLVAPLTVRVSARMT